MHDCGDCPLTDRRGFLAGALGAAAATAGLFWPAGAHGVTIRFAEARRRVGNTLVYPVPQVDGATIDRDANVILARDGGFVYAFARRCPHQNTALRWRAKDNRFQCPKHKSKYEPDGTFISGRATRGMDRHPIRLQGGDVVIDTSQLFKEDEDPAAWNAARAALG